MSLLSHFNSEHFHHAYYVIGDIVSTGKEIEDHCRATFGAEYNVQNIHFERLKIDDVSELRTQSQERGNKIFIIEIAFAMGEAQNALLKTIEEPAEGTHFIFCVPQENTLITTIQSRCEKIFSYIPPPTISAIGAISIQNFLKQNHQERLEYIKKENESWTNEDVLNFITNLEYHIHAPLRGSKETDVQFLFEHGAKLEKLEKLKSYLSSPSASVSMIMEMIALIV